MVRRYVLLGILVAAAWLPLAVVMYGAPATCCYGTTCATYPGCNLTTGDPGTPHCKRLCSPQCTEGNKCCQYQIRTCTYTGGDCPPNGIEVCNVSVYEYKKCESAGSEVECLQTAVSACE